MIVMMKGFIMPDRVKLLRFSDEDIGTDKHGFAAKKTHSKSRLHLLLAPSYLFLATSRISCLITFAFFMNYHFCMYYLAFAALFYLILFASLSPKNMNYMNYFAQAEVCLFTAYYTYYLGFGLGFEFHLYLLFMYFFLNSSHGDKVSYAIVAMQVLLFFVLYNFFGAAIELPTSMKVTFFALNLAQVAFCMLYLQHHFELRKNLRLINVRNQASFFRSQLSHDALTKALNKFSFLEALGRLFDPIENIDRYSYLGFFAVNIEGFTQINSLYSYERGNEILESVGKIIHAHSPASAQIARWSGDRFVVAVFDMEESLFIDFCKNLQQGLSGKKYTHHRIKIFFNFGASFALDPQLDKISEILSLALNNMGQSALEGKNKMQYGKFGT